MLLSVIVPVFNAGEYLQPCIQSLLDLPIEKEIIIVDDGSSDGCVTNLNVKSDKLRILSQTNQGVSAARNAGLEVATGDWIWFVDADDQTCVQSSLVGIEQSVQAMTNLFVLPFVWEENGVANRFDAQDGEIPYNLWRCWFRRKTIESQNLRFTIGRKFAEDQEFILRFLLHGENRTLALDRPVYHYTMRSTGTMMSPGNRQKQLKDLLCVLSNFIWNAIKTGKITQPWVIKQIKRIIKNIIII